MFLPDVNILIHAFRTDSPDHQRCKTWLDAHIHTDGALAISTLVLLAVVRITTTRRFFVHPSTMEDAFRFCNAIRDLDTIIEVEPGARHWDIFRSLCIDSGIRGPMTTDAWLAALAIEWNCEFVTLDHDFARFPRLKWSKPA